MNRVDILKQIKEKRSFLCIGLDSDLAKIPSHLHSSEDPIFEFNKQIIDATKDLCVSYKTNIAFYESLGVKGWQSLQKTLDYIPDNIFTIADAKRGDIGNTSKMYASAFFENMNFDAITVSPYMGEDSVRPFLEFKGKWTILLALTSNKGGLDFQKDKNEENGKYLYENVIDISSRWTGSSDTNMMYVIGATRSEDLVSIRQIIPNHFLLVPGVGVQGGDLTEVAKYGMNDDCGILVNSSRAIIYASSGEDFAERAHEEAKKMQQEMSSLLSTRNL